MAEDRMFSQAELDRIISDRLAKERAKFQQEADQRMAELNMRERLMNAKADWSSRGLPAALLDSIDMTKEGALEAAEIALGGITAKPTKVEQEFPMPMFTHRMGNQPKIEESDGLRNAFGLDQRKDE